MNVFHFGDDDAKESAEEKPVTQKSSYKENIIRKSKCNNKHLAVVDDDDDDEDGDNTARGILLEDLYRSTSQLRRLLQLPPRGNCADSVSWLLFLVGVSVSGPLGAPPVVIVIMRIHFLLSEMLAGIHG